MTVYGLEPSRPVRFFSFLALLPFPAYMLLRIRVRALQRYSLAYRGLPTRARHVGFLNLRERSTLASVASVASVAARLSSGLGSCASSISNANMTMGNQRDIASFFGGGSSRKETAGTSTVAAGAAKRQKTLRVESSSEEEIDAETGRETAKAVVQPAEKASPAASSGSMDLGDVEEGSQMETESGASPSKALAPTTSIDSLVTWTRGEAVPFTILTEAFEKIADTTKRLEIQAILTDTFRAIIRGSPAELLPTVYLCTNRVSPAHEGVELGIGDSTLIKALAQATGRKEAAIKADLDEFGDLGVVAAQSRGRQKQMFKPKPLTISGVLGTFRDIASSEGAKSQDRKIKLIIKLLAAASENEAGYLMRALQGKLRIGLAEQTVLIALAHAKYYEGLAEDSNLGASDSKEDRETAVAVVKSVYSECPSYDLLIPALLEEDIQNLPKRVHFSPGIPVKPMLAKPTNGVTEVLEKFSEQPFTCEYKYDGERAQIHVLEDGSVKIYSRNSEDNTGKYPDIAAMFPGVLQDGVKSIVMDAEAVAYDPEKNKILPFQILSTRARKSVTVENVKVHVCVYAFDCLYLNGEALLKKPLTERREALYGAVRQTTGKMELATAKTSHDVEELSKFLDESVEHGTEGLIVKTLGDSYEPSKRSSHWLKLKKDYLDGCGDTFDLVPIGAWYGKGKRTGVYGSYLLAIWDPDNEEFQAITKIGTGFSEEALQSLHMAAETCEKKRYFNTPDTIVPDVWFEPKHVWEVKAADLSISPGYKAGVGLVDESKGISIRFPRFVRIRDDKDVTDSTSPEQVADMYKSQAVIARRCE